jgi:hypothetical protein
VVGRDLRIAPLVWDSLPWLAVTVRRAGTVRPTWRFPNDRAFVTFRLPAAQYRRARMKCEELLQWLNEYVDGTVDPGICAEFEKHLAGCNPCQIVVDNIRKTITLYKAGEPYEMPVEFQERLHRLLRERWQQTRGRTGPAA